MPPSSPFQFATTATPQSTSAPDRPTQSQNVEDSAQNLYPPTAASTPSPDSDPQSTPQQPSEADSMDTTLDIPQPQSQPQPQPQPQAQLQPEESSSSTVPSESTAEPEAINSVPEVMETELATNPEVVNDDAVPTVNSSSTDAEPPTTTATEETVPGPNVTGAPDNENDPHVEPSSEQPSSDQPSSQDSADTQPEQNNSQDDPQSDSPDSPSSEEEHAYWADIEQDTSSPDEEEIKEIESGDDYSALDYDYWEKTFYSELDDPEYTPAEKARLTWKFKGVRGTKEKPNRATIMKSPAAFVGGLYWRIKFFPRGNNVSSLSVYVESSPTPPEQDKDIPETEFKVFKGPANVVLSDLVPEVDIILPATADSCKETATAPAAVSQGDEKQEPPAEGDTQPTPAEEPASEQSREPPPSEPSQDWRVSAQIGVIVYNPNEPRTAYMQSSCHQFNINNVDWGWTTFHGPWDQIHKRQRGQRQALLQNDTLAFDAYIRIIDDPTQSLWWHSSECEPIWDSLSLTGYRPMGASTVEYSFEVAGLVSWLLLAPFREIIQSVDILEHITTPGVRPRPLCEALQKLLWALRTPHLPQLSVDTDSVTKTLRNLEEFSGDVMEFWERFRRSLELELEGTDAVEKLAKIFDGEMVNSSSSNSNNNNNSNTIADSATDEQPDTINCFRGDFNSRIKISAETSNNVESAVKQYLSDKPGKWSLPTVLHVEVSRQKFDKASRQWQFISRRVGLDEELDLSDLVAEPQSGKYSLYGFVVYKGERTSRHFYSILRPGGPGSRWLAFENEGDSKIECLTSKAAIDAHEGISPQDESDDPRSRHDVAVVVMYVRNDVLPQFLTGKIEPWDIPETRQYFFETGNLPFTSSPSVAVEAYSLSDLALVGNNLFDVYDLMETSRSVGRVLHFTLPARTTIAELREKLALWQSNEDTEVKPQDIRLWRIGRPKSCFAPTSQLTAIQDLCQSLVCSEMDVLRLWMHVLTKDGAKVFAVPNPPVPADAFENEPIAEEIAEPTDEPSNPADESPPEDQEGQEAQEAQEAQDVDMADSNTSADPLQMGEGGDATILPSNQPSEGVRVADETETPGPETLLPSDNNSSSDGTRQDLNNPSGRDVQMTDAEPDTNTSQHLQTEPIDAEPNAEEVNIREIAMGAVNEAPTVLTDATADPAAQATTPERPGEFQVGDEAGSGELATTDTEHVSIPAPTREDSVMEDAAPGNPADVSTNEHSAAIPMIGNTENDINEIAPPPMDNQIHPPIRLTAQVYYFVQIFDVEKQEFRFAGAFYGKRSNSIKASVRAALGWPDDKSFNLWHRVDGVSISSISSKERFNTVLATDQDGECFIVEEVLPKSQCTKISESGSLNCPGFLIQYLWALSRRHPTNSFTGTKTVDAVFNGEYYSGEFKKGCYHGKGTSISNLGATYTGDFVIGQRHGKGVLESQSGDTYDGDWFEDQQNGQGTFIERRTGNKYIGGFRAGKRHGKGISYWEVAAEEMGLCQICYSEDQDALFYSCGHVCACVSCAKRVDKCPICRKKVANVVKIYRT
ncbi:ubiquitin thiolesterase [Blastomyces silverae]|uniref:Ubiquitin thiolesterase n=1 Tax=Blastomyces silverae TaxID=2060906 RepID=A0A0H1BJ68_9EURO|nr:ubiquitin thiolesterase [Blastomyces silverae]